MIFSTIAGFFSTSEAPEAPPPDAASEAAELRSLREANVAGAQACFEAARDAQRAAEKAHLDATAAYTAAMAERTAHRRNGSLAPLPGELAAGKDLDARVIVAQREKAAASNALPAAFERVTQAEFDLRTAKAELEAAARLEKLPELARLAAHENFETYAAPRRDAIRAAITTICEAAAELDKALGAQSHAARELKAMGLEAAPFERGPFIASIAKGLWDHKEISSPSRMANEILGPWLQLHARPRPAPPQQGVVPRGSAKLALAVEAEQHSERPATSRHELRARKRLIRVAPASVPPADELAIGGGAEEEITTQPEPERQPAGRVPERLTRGARLVPRTFGPPHPVEG